jgi:hypothetical protein
MAWTTAGVCPYWLANWTVVRNGPSQPAATLLSRFCNRGERRMNDRSIGVDAAVAPTSVPAARGATAEPCGTRTMVVREWGCAAAAATPTVIDMRTAPTASSGTNRRVLGEGRDADIRADPFGQVGVGTTRSCRRSAGRNLDPPVVTLTAASGSGQELARTAPLQCSQVSGVNVIRRSQHGQGADRIRLAWDQKTKAFAGIGSQQ